MILENLFTAYFKDEPKRKDEDEIMNISSKAFFSQLHKFR